MELGGWLGVLWCENVVQDFMGGGWIFGWEEVKVGGVVFGNEVFDFFDGGVVGCSCAEDYDVYVLEISPFLDFFFFCVRCVEFGAGGERLTLGLRFSAP